MDIDEKFNRWEFAHTPPMKPGTYWVKSQGTLGTNTFIADYVCGFSGQLYWNVPHGTIITHWKFR